MNNQEVTVNGLPKDLHQFAHPPNRALNFTYPPLAIPSATFHSRLKTELFKISYPGSTPAPPPFQEVEFCCIEHNVFVHVSKCGNGNQLCSTFGVIQLLLFDWCGAVMSAFSDTRKTCY